MRQRSFVFRLLVLVAALPLAGSVNAQDEERPTPIVIGGFQTQGSVTAGYRFTDIKGRRQKFLELFDLQKGFRLMDFNLFGEAPDGANAFADSFSLFASGLGGDPFPTAQLSVRKNRLYDLRVNWRQSYYYWDRNDAAVLPTGLHGLTTNHDWATVRKFGSANFLLHATNNLRFAFEYYRTSRDGVNFTTRDLDYFGSPGLWGFFTRANPYLVEAPLSDTANRFAGGIDYTRRDWTFHYRAGYQTMDESIRGNNLASPQRSFDIDAPPTVNEQVNHISWLESRQLKTPLSEFSYVGRAGKRLDLRGGYIFYRYRGPATLNSSFDGIARKNIPGTAFAPYTVSLDTRANISEPNHVIDQGLTYKVKGWWNILLDYRYSRFTQDIRTAFHSLRDGAVATDGDGGQAWRQGLHQLDLNLEFAPTRSLLIRPGIRLLKRDILGLVDGVADDVLTRRIKTAWPEFSVYYEPSKILSVRADVDEINNGTSYTRISPHTDVGSRFILRLRPTEKLSIEDSLIVRNRKLLTTDFKNNIRTNAILASYELNERFSIFGGASYDSFFASNSVTFLRGTPPLNDIIWRDQTIDRVWQAGFSAKATPRLGFSFAGNYIRTTGRGEISGELPLYGPMTYPYGTGTVYYEFPRLGRLSIDLQRTYYLEQIVRGDNFSANLLTIRWTREF